MQRVYARNTMIKDISNEKSLVREFLEQNHLQGYCRGNRLAYGLYHKDELVQIMTFGSPRYNRNYQLELIRECTRKGTQVIGGSSKLWKHFIKVNPHVHSVICYTDFNHKHELEFTNHYVKHLGFKTKYKSRKSNDKYWVSNTIPREDSYGNSYSYSLIIHKGPDRVLGTNIGHKNGTNDEIMKSLGYHIETKPTRTPQTDIWYKGGYIYKVTHTPSGRFYIGQSMMTDQYNIKHYLGSGTAWKNILKAHSVSEFNKLIISYHDNKIDLDISEQDLILENIDNPLCLNDKTLKQGEHTCNECLSYGNAHRESCSKFKLFKCELCSSETPNNRHRIICPNSTIKPCQECGSITKHKENCSLSTKYEGCPECKSRGGHFASCTQSKVCSECQGKNGKHKKICSNFPRCPECENSVNRHKTSCSKYNVKKCQECGGTATHFKRCSKASYCDLCGNASTHSEDCPKAKPRIICDLCGGKQGRHKRTCSLDTWGTGINSRNQI